MFGCAKLELLVFFNVYLFLRECKGEEAEREGTEDPKQAVHCQQQAQRGARSHELRDHDLSQSWMLNRQPLRHLTTEIINNSSEYLLFPVYKILY